MSNIGVSRPSFSSYQISEFSFHPLICTRSPESLKKNLANWSLYELEFVKVLFKIWCSHLNVQLQLQINHPRILWNHHLHCVCDAKFLWMISWQRLSGRLAYCWFILGLQSTWIMKLLSHFLLLNRASPIPYSWSLLFLIIKSGFLLISGKIGLIILTHSSYLFCLK